MRSQNKFIHGLRLMNVIIIVIKLYFVIDRVIGRLKCLEVM